MTEIEVPIIDLHCDLLSFLVKENGRSFENPVSRCSYPQMQAGNVRGQTLAIYSKTGPQSVENGRKQIDHFLKLIKEHPLHFSSFTLPLSASSIQLIAAFENASAFATEDEPIEQTLARLESYLQQIAPVFYISMTWDEENRFGGGNRSTAGLKSDGKKLLDWMHGKKIAMDLSHSSDWLAHGILEYMDQKRLKIPVMASHSNFRAITNCPRNLPDDIAKEIIKKEGLIGLNFFAPFVHETDPSVLMRHVEYALHLGAGKNLCFGADFFCDLDFTNILEKYGRLDAFYENLSNASHYPLVLSTLAQTLKVKEEELQQIGYKNAEAFLQTYILKTDDALLQ